MTKNQLRYFVAIVDCGSYLEAALELDMPQSSISKQIQALERELGVDLFDRKARKAKLTPEGKSLLPEARAVLERMEHLSYAASRLRSGHTKRVLVGTLPFIGYLGLYPSLVRFERENPDCLLTVMEMEEPQLMRRMLGDECDLILNYEYEYRLANVGRPFFPLTDDEVVLASRNRSAGRAGGGKPGRHRGRAAHADGALHLHCEALPGVFQGAAVHTERHFPGQAGNHLWRRGSAAVRRASHPEAGAELHGPEHGGDPLKAGASGCDRRDPGQK